MTPSNMDVNDDASGDDLSTIPHENAFLFENSFMDNFNVSVAPEQKTKQDILDQGIDRSSILSVAAIRQMFNKSDAPVFPYREQLAASKDNGTFSPPIPPKSTSLPDTAYDAEITLVPHIHATPVLPFINSTEPENQYDASEDPSQNQRLSDSEFLKLVEAKGCIEALKCCTDPISVNVLIKPNHSDRNVEDNKCLYIKRAMVQYNAQHRFIVMIREKATRYISLHKVIKIDCSPNACDCYMNVPKKMRKSTNKKYPLALYFSTTPNPMIILIKESVKRDHLFNLFVFLHQMLKTSTQLELIA